MKLYSVGFRKEEWGDLVLIMPKELFDQISSRLRCNWTKLNDDGTIEVGL
jgi:hypothetical protein